MKNNINYEEAKKLFDGCDPKEVTESIWESHWNNAKISNSVEILNNLLKNHTRLFNDCPNRNNGKERENIILYLQNKIGILCQ